jgi:hypothetical protein
MFPTVSIVDVSVKLPKSISNFFFSGLPYYRTGTRKQSQHCNMRLELPSRNGKYDGLDLKVPVLPYPFLTTQIIVFFSLWSF